VDRMRKLVGSGEDVGDQLVDPGSAVLLLVHHASPCASSQRMPSRGAQSHDGSSVAAYTNSYDSLATSNASSRSRSTVNGDPACRRPAMYAPMNRSRARSIQAS